MKYTIKIKVEDSEIGSIEETYWDDVCLDDNTLNEILAKITRGYSHILDDIEDVLKDVL